MASLRVKAFLKSQELSFKLFLTQCGNDYNYNNVETELEAHHERLKALVNDLNDKTVTSSTPYGRTSTPKKTKTTPFSSSGKPLTPAGASTIFKTGTAQKRRLPSDGDDSTSDSPADTIAVNNTSPSTCGKRLPSSSRPDKETVDESTTRRGSSMSIDDEVNERPSYRGTARRGGNSGNKKFVFKSPFINK